MLRCSLTFYDFRSVPKISDEFSASISRQSSKYDHILIDVGPFASIGTRVVKGLTGMDRDVETTTFIQRQIFGVVLRKYSAAKSIALFFDGSDPLWKLHRSRKFPKKQENKFYRSCASPMPFMCEERLRTVMADTARGKSIQEFLISGPATAGTVESKMSAYLNDLAARFTDEANGVAYDGTGAADPSTTVPSYCSVQPTDSVLIVGGEEAFLSSLGALPFSNITAVMMDGRDLKSLTLAEGIEWMAMEKLGKPAVAAPGATLTLQQQKARIDALILYLLGNGCSATDLGGVGVNFGELMNAYFDSQAVGGAAAGGKGNFLCELTVTATAGNAAPTPTPTPTIGIDLVRLERVLSKASRRMAPKDAKEDPQAADYLEILLQTVAMFADGGVKNNAFVPKAPLVETPPQMKMDTLLGHLKFLAGGASTTANAVATSGSGAKLAVPTVNPDRFALTAAEQLLLSSTLPAGKPTVASVEAAVTSGGVAAASEMPTYDGIQAVKAIAPSFIGGFELPEAVLNDVFAEDSVKEAAGLASAVMSCVDPNNAEYGYHPGIKQTPSYYFYQTKTVGPPAGYEFLPVNLGIRSETQQTLAAVMAKATSL